MPCFGNGLRAGEFQAAEFTCIGKNGREVSLQATYNPILDIEGRPVKIVKFAMDVSEQKRRFAEIERQKSLFLSNMSHEIRTPMNGIFGMLSLIKDCRLEKDAQAYVDTCIRSADSLLTVLNDVLLYSKAEAGALQLERAPFNLNRVVEDVVHLVSTDRAPDKDIDVTYYMKTDVPVFLLGDAGRLRQVLSNLLGNAVKFTKYGEVSLDVAVASLHPLMIKFDVSDTGIGISEGDQGRLFSPFTQADATITREFGGTGLGLAICKHLAKLFEGTITVQSRLGRGSTFTFVARFDLDSAQAHSSFCDVFDLGEDVSVLRGVKTLIVDDNATNCMALESTLAQFGCKVLSVCSGADAVDALRVASLKGEPFGMCLLDYHMPHMSGIDTARAIASKGFTPTIIALASEFDHALGKEPNILAFCTKPVRRGQLVHLMCKFLRATTESPTTSLSALAGGIMQQVADEENPFRAFTDPAIPKLRVLIAEDNTTNREVLSSLLRREWCDVIEAVNGADAIDKLTDDVRVVLMDVHMPVMDGISATQLILKKRPDVDVIYMTADATEETKAKCSASGAVRLLLKPVKKTLLISTLSNVLLERRTMLLRQNPVAARSFTGIKRLCCLVVDDSQTNRFLAGHLVKKVLGDVDVVFAESGEAALEKTATCSPDLILMDVRMPVGISGIEATRRIRGMLNFVPIVAVTGAGDEAAACKKVGMNDVLIKPLRLEQLAAAILPLLKQHVVAPQASLLVDDSFLEDVDVASRKLLLDDWRTTCGEQISQLLAFCSKKAWKDLRDVAHSLKGSAAQLGAVKVSESAAKIETLGRSGEEQLVATLTRDVEELARLIDLTLVHLKLCGNCRAAKGDKINE